MTNEELKRLVEVDLKRRVEIEQAYLDGKEIEYRDRCKLGWEVNDCPVFEWENFDYRVKSEPKLRPWTIEDVPFPCQIRVIGAKVAQSVTVIYVYGIETEKESVSYKTLSLEYEYRTSHNEPWKPCGVEE